nr:Chain B, Kinase D-interacting substrate of 220 kDa [Rattus norvegicus]
GPGSSSESTGFGEERESIL